MHEYTVLKNIPETVFRAYDIRGVVEKELSPDFYYSLGLALAEKVLAVGESEAAIGYDGREQSPIFADANNDFSVHNKVFNIAAPRLADSP